MQVLRDHKILLNLLFDSSHLNVERQILVMEVKHLICFGADESIGLRLVCLVLCFKTRRYYDLFVKLFLLIPYCGIEFLFMLFVLFLGLSCTLLKFFDLQHHCILSHLKFWLHALFFAFNLRQLVLHLATVNGTIFLQNLIFLLN